MFQPNEVLAALRGAAVSPATRAVLETRIRTAGAETDYQGSRFFDAAETRALEELLEGLVPQASRGDWHVEIASAVDHRLASGEGNGWRYAAEPADGLAYRQGIRHFLTLREKGLGLDAAIAALRTERPRFYEEILTEACEIYYSHPFAQGAIGALPFVDGNPPAAAREVPAARRLTPEEEVDAVVIGTGAGGAPLLARLAAAGLKVVALEAGPRFRPGQDFATDERSQRKIFWNHERLSAGKTPIVYGNNNSGTGVGGSTLHFTAYTPRPQADDFHLRRDFGRGRDWPFGLEALLPYLAEVEETLGVSGPADYPWGAPRAKPYPLPPLPLNPAARFMADACRTLGIRTSPAANAALSGPRYQPGFGWRPACSERGYCQAGCSSGAKSSMDLTYLPLAESRGAEIRPDAFAYAVDQDRDGRVRAVHYLQDGKSHRLSCRHLFLAAGAVETPRFLLMNKLANRSGQVGKNLMAHPGAQVWGFFPEATNPSRGIPGGLISEDFHRAPAGEYDGGFLLQSIGVMPVTYASQLARAKGLRGEELHSHMANFSRVAGINILGECFPSPGNFLELSEEKDATGFPKPRSYFSAGENEIRLRDFAIPLMEKIWTAAGAEGIWSMDRYAHVIGTAVMGEDPATSVVDPSGRAHEIPNLYVCDNSVFPSALAVNPSLTIMANSLRMADAFLQESRL